MNMIKVPTSKKDETPLIIWGGDDPFTHTLCVGPTRCGKTATVLKPLIYSILLAKKRGIPCGLSIIEPKGDVARMVKEMAEAMGLKDQLVYIDPLYPDETQRINVMKGNKQDVAEATVAVLKSLFGKQDAFFATVQELSSRKVTLLLKELYGDNMDIMDVLANLRDVALLQTNVEKLRQLQGTNDLVQFFDNELLGTGNMADKYRQFIVGLRAQLENITSNEHLKAIVTGRSDIDLDEHFEEGRILAVNTALGMLGRSGDAFGMFMAMHLQLATFRRKGTESTRVPHYLIIDEYSRYINPDVERFLSIAAEYRVALIAAIQSLGQLELESGNLSAKAMKRAILTSTRNKIIFGGLEYEDAEEVSKIMGKDLIRERARTFSGGILENILPKQYKEQEEEKERFYSTFLMDGLPRFHYVHKLLVDGTPQEPGIGVGSFIPRDWKEQLEIEFGREIPEKVPPIWKWRERAEFEVKRKRKQEAEAREEKAKLVLADNPFEDEEDVVSSIMPIKTNNFTERQADKLEIDNPPEKEYFPEVQNSSNPESIIFSISGQQRAADLTESAESKAPIIPDIDKEIHGPVIESGKGTAFVVKGSEKSETEENKKIKNPIKRDTSVAEIVPPELKQSSLKVEKEVIESNQNDEDDDSSFW
ncbi:type IV secretory system conjugative DNA transfer family protein [Cytobacillus pseudoceanisediminis]|uniref:type IV secretory system conjugative DNA transfer family protein n=1 Tax=Cytobacillus pseudoceanisediminis TaxID=3051614 RepID=UPI003C2BA399